VGASPNNNPTAFHVPDHEADVHFSLGSAHAPPELLTTCHDLTIRPLEPQIHSIEREFKVLGEIGRGGMGIVYRAHDLAVNRQVAVKVLQERFRGNPPTIARFVEEGQITGQLQHPGIPAIYQIGTLIDGSPYLAMKLIKGETLADRLEEPLIDRTQLVTAFLNVAQTMGYAHSKNVIHRDLKPSNIMVGQFGEVQVMDWGLAKILSAETPQPKPDEAATHKQSLIETDRSSDPGSYTQVGSVLGTPSYMSPEQAGGETQILDERTDVFGLGAVLCEILTGQPPYSGGTVEAVRLQAVRGDCEQAYKRLESCNADKELIALCKLCLARDREARPRNGGEVASILSAHLATAENRLRLAERERDAAEIRVGEQRKRRRWQAAVAGAGVLILTLVFIGMWWMDHLAAAREKDRAVTAERDRFEAASALGRAEDALGIGNLSLAEIAITQVESRLTADSPADLRTRLTDVNKNRDFVRDLREIENTSWSPGDISMPDRTEMSKRCRTAFIRYGLDVSGIPTESAADIVTSSRISNSLVAGLGEWFIVDPHQPQLGFLLDRLDTSPVRIAIRAAIVAGDEERIQKLVAELDGSATPVWFAASIGYHPMVPFDEGIRLMAASWRSQPTDYLLAYRIANRLWGKGDKHLGEMLTWARVAVALRPESPFSHNLLGTAWRGLRNWAEAEASARRAIELSRNYPKYAGAHAGLGNVYLQKGDLGNAEACYRAALAIDPDAAAIAFNLSLLFSQQNKWSEAETWSRQAVAAAPNNDHFRQFHNTNVQKIAVLARLRLGIRWR
jgi:serine/threonine protein kinase